MAAWQPAWETQNPMPLVVMPLGSVWQWVPVKPSVQTQALCWLQVPPPLAELHAPSTMQTPMPLAVMAPAPGSRRRVMKEQKNDALI